MENKSMQYKHNSNTVQKQMEQKKEEQVQVKAQRKEKLSAEKAAFSFSFAEKDEVDAELRKPRSRAYMELFSVIDMLSSTDEEIIEQLKANMDEETAEEFAEMTAEEILEEIKACFQEEFLNLPIEVETVMYGVLSKCFIGGCDCHAIGPQGEILAHYSEDGPMPEELEKGRIVFHRYPKCRCVEVYKDCCRVVFNDASVIKLCNSEI